MQGLPEAIAAGDLEWLGAAGTFLGSFVGAIYLLWKGREKFFAGRDTAQSTARTIIRPGAAVIDSDGGQLLAGALEGIGVQMVEGRQQAVKTAKETTNIARGESEKLRALLTHMAKEREEQSEALNRLLSNQNASSERVHNKLMDVLEQVRHDLHELARELRRKN